MRRVLIVALVLVATAGVVVGGLTSAMDEGEVLWTYAWVLWAPVGGLILWHRPGNHVGSALLLVGLSWALSFWLMPVLTWDIPNEALAWVELLNTLFGVMPWLGIIWLLLVFPVGTPAGRFERALLRLLVAVGGYALLAFALSPEPMEETELVSPLALKDSAGITDWIVSDAGFVIVLTLVGLTVASLVRRWRRSEGLERAQFHWLLLGTSIYAVVLTVGQVLPGDFGFGVPWVVAGGTIPVVIAIAVFRYRLYEIDRIVSRTVSYVIVMGLLVGIFAAGVVWVPTLLQLPDSPLVVAGSTLAVAALFNPLRGRIQGWVDLRFNRSRYDIERVMDAFASSLREQVDPGGVVEGWVDVVSETMQPHIAGVWVRE